MSLAGGENAVGVAGFAPLIKAGLYDVVMPDMSGWQLARLMQERHPALPVPPTFAFSLGLGAPAKKGNVFEVIEDLSRILHGEQSFTYRHMLYAGDTATLTSKIADIYDKRNGALEFIVQDTAVVNQHGKLCVEMRTVTVVRNG